MQRRLIVISTIVAAMWLYGCGGSDTASENYLLPAGKTVLTFSAMSTARLPTAISGIEFTLKLPAGMSVATVSGPSGSIATASVVSGSALGGTNLAFGSYSASTGKSRLSMATSGDSYRSGEFLRLTCDVAANSSITINDLKALNTPVTVLKAVGFDPVSLSTTQLTDRVKVTLGMLR
jgi:hypothetical protein